MTNKEKTLKFLDDIGIKYDKIEHNICYTMKDLEEEGVTKHGNIYKNFFLRNAKGNKHYVISMNEFKNINIQDIAKKIGSTRLSFASDERLKEHLKIEKGQVGPLSVINNPEKTVEFFFDSDIINEKKLGIHPNDNSATIFLEFDELKKVFVNLNIEFNLIEI